MKILAILLLTFGAAQTCRAASPPEVDWRTESIFLVGSKTNTSSVVPVAVAGTISDGAFVISKFKARRMNQKATGEYFIGVAKGNESIGFSTLEWYATGILNFGPSYSIDFCENRPSPAFSAVPGKIFYMGDLYFQVGDVNGDKGLRPITYGFGSDPESARAWVEKHYPGELSRFVVADTADLPVQRECKPL